MKLQLKLGAIALFALSSVAQANDEALLREELLDLKAKVASLETTQMAPAAGGDCASLTSMKKKGQIQIGGDIELDINAVYRDKVTSDDDSFQRTNFGSTDTDLNFKVMADCNTYLWMKLDLDDLENGVANQDDILEELYFKWMNIRGWNLDVRLGKGELPYGQDKDVVITDSYAHNATTGSWLGTTQGTYPGVSSDGSSTTTAINTFNHPGEVDNAYMIEGTWTWKDLVKVEAALFQNPGARDMHEDKSADNLLFQSWCARVTYTPMENLALKASWITLNDENHWDIAHGSIGLNQDSKSHAVSLAADWTLKSIPLELFGEYQHGFGWNNESDNSVNTATVGGIYGLTKNIDLIAEAEWLGINSDAADNHLGAINPRTQNGSEDYYKGVMAGKYKFDNGIYMMLEYCHEWYEQENAPNGDQREADVVSFRTAWSF